MQDFFGQSNVLIIATLFLIAFTLMGIFDGLYFHIFKYKLQRLPEARLEHFIHAARGFFLVPITIIFFAINSGGLLLWVGFFLLIIDTILEFIDILVEKSARRFIGGMSSAESILHVMATGARVAAIALVLGAKPSDAYSLTSPAILPIAYPLFLHISGSLVAIGSGLGTLFQMCTMFVAYLVRSQYGPEISNEGLFVKDYNIFHIYASALPALLLEGMLKLIRPTIQEVVVGKNMLPDNAILYSFHKDSMLTLTSKAIISMPKWGYIGYHGFWSYVPTFYYNRLGVKAIRFKRGEKEKPKDKIIHELKNREGIIVIRTDAGKPYGKVRASLIDLSKESGRPLVPLVQRADRFLTIAHHTLPLRHAKITTIFGDPIFYSDISHMTRDVAQKFLQTKIDQLTTTY